MIVGYVVEWSHGQTGRLHPTYEEALEEVRAVLSEPEIGHSGDLRDGGERTLFWSDAELADNDDGSRAAGCIVARRAPEDRR